MKKLFAMNAIVLVLTLCLGIYTTPSALAEEPVKIGVIISMTGACGEACQECFHAIELAVEEINESGGVLGRPLKLVVEDAESRSKAGVEAAHKLADVNKVPVVIGNYMSSIAFPVGKILNSKKIVFVTVATTNKMKAIGPYVFDVADLADQAAALVDFAWNDSKARKFLSFTENNPIGQDRGDTTVKRVKELGGTIVDRMHYTVGGKDFRSDLMRLMQSNADAFICEVYMGDAIIIQRQLYEMGVTDFSKFYSYNLGAMTGVPDPKMVEGYKGANYTTLGPRASEYRKKYIQQYGKSFKDPWSPPFYDAAWIVAMAINIANSLDPKEIRNAMWPAAYIYQGVSAGGDKGFNMYGMQALDVTEKQVIRNGVAVTYIEEGGTTNLLPFRYKGEEGITRQFAPSEEEFMKLYPDYKP